MMTLASMYRTTDTRTIVTRLLLFLLIWWVLTDGTTASWWIGVPVVALALVTSIILLPPVPINPVELLKFMPFFLTRSLQGGVDVAWRAFHPAMPIDPELVEYPIRLPAGLAQVFMANTVNLLPGTLSATLEHNTMKVHVLDRQKAFVAEIEAIENSMSRIFRLPLNTPARDR